jgi:subfamily B ATP-binding cassette protein MsbA
MNVYKRLLQFIRPYWIYVILAMVCSLFVSLATALSAWIVKPVLDDVFVNRDAHMIKLLPLVIIGIYLVKGVFGYTHAYLIRSVGQKVIRDMRNLLYSHIQHLSLSFFNHNSTGSLMSRIINDIAMIQHSVSNVISSLFLEVITMIGLAGVAFFRDWKLALIAFTVMPLIAFYTNKLGRKIKNITRRGQEKIAILNAYLQETFVGARIIKAFCREDYVIERFREQNQKYYRTTMKNVRADELTTPLVEFFASIGVGGVVFYGGYQVVLGHTTPGTFFSFMAAMMMMYSPVRKISKANNVIQQAIAAAGRVFDLLDTKSEIQEKKDAITLPEIADSIVFENVSFQYNSNSGPVLKNINLKARKGEKIALVGMSGVGKSTLMDLLPRFYDPKEGRILIDGIDIRDVTLSSLRAQIGIVSQEIILFNDTFANNIRFGRLDASEQDIIEAAKAAYAHNFIMESPQGYNTVIGDRGVRLSGGERQRIAIARALLKNPSILILDEATSSLDTESEYMVQKALENLMKNRTTFIIAHRLSTVRNADKIIAMEGGRIVEIGTHDQLVNAQGIYNKLYDIQFRIQESKSEGSYLCLE